MINSLIPSPVLNYCSRKSTCRAGPGLALLLAIILIPIAVEGAPGRSNQSWGEGKVFKPEFADLVRDAHLIVLGKVVETGKIPRPGPTKRSPKTKGYAYWEDQFAVLEVEQIIKGKMKGGKVKVAFHSDLEGDETEYRSGDRYIAFLYRPRKYRDAYTTAHFHFGEYRINERGRAERVADPSEISKPPEVIIEKIRKVLGPSAKSR